jgi:hypothetical protein
MRTVESSETQESRAEAANQTANLIVKLWDHRASLPGRANPMYDYQAALELLSNIRTDSNSFWSSRSPPTDSLEGLCEEVVKAANSLADIFLRTQIPEEPPSKTVLDHLSKEQLEILIKLYEAPASTDQSSEQEEPVSAESALVQFRRDRQLKTLDSVIEAASRMRNLLGVEDDHSITLADSTEEMNPSASASKKRPRTRLKRM